ncbi:sensor histidine kinase [Pseudonocardia phyllosphaerae]|uniref:sensor histidine kinase n=1 Tax=Pseudonocardia phyllosphaerae TaxID=3390502 RepID=UPI00397B6B6A
MISYLAARTDGPPSLARDAGVGLAWFAVGLALALGLSDAAISWWGPGGGPTAVSLGVMALGCAASLLRRRYVPAGLLVATAALISGPLWGGRTEVGTVLVFTDLLYCAVLFPPRRTARAVAVGYAGATALLVLFTLVTAGTRPAVYSLLNLVLIVGIPLVWGAEVRRHVDVADLERARAAEARRAAARERDAAVAAERARMARDLHDVVAGRLSAIALQSEAALQPGTDPELARRVLVNVRESGVAALGEMRTMIGLLRDGGPDDTTSDPPGAPARLTELPGLVESYREGGLDVALSDDRETGTALPAAVELAGHRIVQESLTNAAKHAPGSQVTVHLATRDEELRIEVRNGPGARPAAGPGLHGGTGLAGLAERARAVGGTVTAGPDDDGWRVRADLPVAGEAS